jgi:dephospho-CoA kinase
MIRDQLDAASAQQRIESQMPLAEKIALADVNLDNSTTLEQLERQIDSKITLT